MNRRSHHLAWKELLRRIDRAAADLNIVLLVFAIGLAALDMTFLVTQKVVERLPQVTRVSYQETAQQAAPTADNASSTAIR